MPPRRARGRAAAIASPSDSDPEWDPAASASEEAADDAPLSRRRASRGAREGARRRASPTWSSESETEEPSEATPRASRGARARATARASAGSRRPATAPAPTSSTRRRGRAVVDSDDDDAGDPNVGTPREKGPAGASGAGSSGRPRRSNVAARAAASSGKPLELRRGIRSPSPSEGDDDSPPSSGARARPDPSPSGIRRRRRRESPTRGVLPPPPSSSRRGVARVRRRSAPDEGDWEYGTMRYRPAFYDRRTRHRFVNAERASSDEELTSDSFVADDEDDDGDEDSSSDDEGDDPRNRDRRGRRRRETSLERFEREEREKQRADADADAEAPPPRSGAAAAGAGEKSSAGEKSPPPAPDPEDAGSSDDDAVRAGAGRRRRGSNRRVVLIDDEPDAPAPAPAPAAGSPRPAAPASAPEDSSPSSSTARRRRRSSASLGAEDADPEPQLTPGGRRASARVLGKRRRDTETWNRTLEALREGMRREDDGGDDSGDDGAGFDGDGGSFSGGVLDADRDDDLHDFVVFDEDDLAVARARGGWSPESDRYDSDFVSDVSAAEDEDGSEEAEDEWVLCECGATADDGSAMVRCGNPRCEVWQHATCVDVDAEEAARPSFAFFCARCDANGRENAPEPPGKPSPRTRTTGASERKKQTRRRKKQTTRARAPDPEGSNPKPSRSGWREKMIAALRADDPEAVDRCLRAVSWPSARAPRFEGMLARAAEFDAREVAAALLGTTGRPGTGPGPAPGGGKKSVASSRRVGLADLARGDATRSKVARALHVALAAGHVGVAEAIRDAMGPRFPARGRQDPWPKAAGGATLAHSASDNARGDPRAVWLALEAEGEPPRAGDEACAAAAADASRAAAAEAEERARDARDRVGGSEPGPSRAGGVRAVGGRVVVDAPIAARRTLGDYARAGAYAAGVPTPEAFPLVAGASAATTSPATTRRRDDSRGPPPPAHDTPAAALGDDAQVTPLMRACAAGPGWEGCVAALLWSAGARGRSRPEGFQGAAASCVAVKESSASESAPHHAARTGAAASLRLLLAALPGAVRAADVGGATPLHHAASAGEAGAIETLVADAGASRCARDDKGWIPLLYADWSEKREAVLVLMSENLQEQLGAMHDIMDSEISRPRVLKALRMLATVPPFYDALNEFVSTRIGLLSGSLSFLLHRRAKVVNFANRRAWLERRIEEHVNRHYAYHRGAWVEEDLYGKSLVASHRAPWRDFRRWCVDAGPARLARQPLMYHFRFAGAHAMGMGQGVERELMERLAADVTGAAGRAGDGESEEDAPGGDEGPRAAGGEGGPERWFPSADAPLLAPTSEGSDAYAPPPLPETLPRDVEEQYVVFGRLLGYVVMHKAGPFPVSLANAFLRGLLGEGVEGLSREALAEDLEEMDPQEARSLDIVRGMESDVEALGLTFTAEEEELVFEPEAAREDNTASSNAPSSSAREDNTASSNAPSSSRVGKKTVERELCPGGAARAVTSANREEYCALRVARRVKRVAACGAVRFARRGLREMIPHEFLRVFSPAEFACVLGGDADVDVDHLRRHATYLGGYDGDSPQIKWLWRLVARFEPNERSLLLKFATGSSRVPAGGFSKEAGRGSVCVMKVPAGRRGPGGRDGDGDGDGDGGGGAGQFALPTAATCFNTLRLPEYPTYEALEQHVTVALRHGVEGFSFG